MSEEDKKEILKFINTDTNTQSLLYDIDLLPEQLKEDTMNWVRMIAIGWLVKDLKKTEKENEELKSQLAKRDEVIEIYKGTLEEAQSLF